MLVQHIPARIHLTHTIVRHQAEFITSGYYLLMAMSTLFWHRRSAPDFASLVLALFEFWKVGTAGHMNVINAVIDPIISSAIEKRKARKLKKVQSLRSSH